MKTSFKIILKRSAAILTNFRIELSLRLETAGVDEDTISQFELCTYEVLINIIEHSANLIDEPIAVRCIVTSENITVKIRYRGDGFDPTGRELPDIEDHFSAGKSRGLGIYIIHTLMDELDFTTEDDISILTMKKNR